MRYRFGEFELDTLLFELRRSGEIVRLEPKIFDVLALLIHRRDHVVGKDELLESLWPGEFVSESVLPRCIATARRALGDARDRAGAISTVHGRGYRFVAPVVEVESGSSPAGLAPVRPSLFVGREDILARLRGALDETQSGRGRMALLVGEPGIGKTRTAEELAREAVQRGARVLRAHCHEGEGAPAYWLWVQVLRACLRGSEAEGARQATGPGADDIALLVPEMRSLTHLPAASPLTREAVAADESRFRLFDSITTFLRAAWKARPLVLLLDDLHWADESSLLLLPYLAREMREARLLVIGTYRDVELRRHHPLVRVLGALAREPLCERLHLRGLPQEDVGRFIEGRAGAPPAEALVQAVCAMTEGNPFFIGEILGLLESEGRLRAVPPPETWQIILPQSVREAIGRRLDSLSAASNRLLAVASVLGRDFEVAFLDRVLRSVSSDELDLAWPPSPAPGSTRQEDDPGLGGGALLQPLAEAVSAHLLTAESAGLGRFAFSHALVRQTLYEELPIPTRLRLHQAVAGALEEVHAADLDPRLSQIAYHLFEGAAAGSAARAVDYSLRAARRAYAQLAYEESAAHCERALQLLDFLTAAPDVAERRFEVLLALADALSVAGARERSQEICRRAAEISRRLGRPDLLARAVLIFGQRDESGPLPAQELRGLLEESMTALGEAEPALRSRLLSRLSSISPYQDSMPTRRSMSAKAAELARQAGDSSALSDALAAQLWAMLGPDHDQDRILAADDFTRLVEQTGQKERLLIALEHRCHSFLACGDLATADRTTEAGQKLAQSLRQPSYLLFAKWYWVARALGDGRFAQAEDLMRESFALGQRIQHPATDGMLMWHRYWFLRQRDELEQFETSLPAALRPLVSRPGMEAGPGGLGEMNGQVDELMQHFAFGGPFLPSVAASIYLALGRESEALQGFQTLAAKDFADIPRDEWWTATLTHLAEVAVELGESRQCDALYRLLEPFAERNAFHALLRTYGGAMTYFLGLLAAAMRRPQEAAAHFELALERNAALGARPALVRTQYAYGRLLVAQGRRADMRRARELQQSALATAQELDLTGLAGRIQKEILKSS